MRWERDTGRYASGEILHLGKWKVGGFHFDSSRSKDEPNKWCATCSLPGIKRCLGHFAKEEESRAKVEEAVKHWLSGLPSNEPAKGRARKRVQTQRRRQTGTLACC